MTALSAISMSAIATNGQIAGGGVYYIISRTLGPALGGSIGLMFTMANIISVATYTIGFSESLLDLLADVIPSWDGIVVPQSACSVAGKFYLLYHRSVKNHPKWFFILVILWFQCP